MNKDWEKLLDELNDPEIEDDLLKDRSTLADEFMTKLADELSPAKNKENPLWEPQPGAQNEGFYCEADEMLYGGSAGSGKLFDNNTLIPTIQGAWKRAENIKVGDQLISHDGGSTRVLAVYPHENIDLYRFKFIDGAEIVTGGEHLWMHWYAGKKIKADRKYFLYSPVKGLRYASVRGRLELTKNLYEYHLKQEKNVKNGKRPYWAIMPLSSPIRYTFPIGKRKPNWIDPYFLGLLIGDGSIMDNQISITTTDDEIKDFIYKFWGYDRTYYDGVKHIVLNDSNELKTKLEFWELLNHYSYDKFIPKTYLYSSVEDRLKLMDGLISTDGYVDKQGHVEYTTVSPQLIKDVQQLAWSLGAKATITSKTGAYKHPDTGEHIECREAYTLYIQSEDNSKFVTLKRKHDRCKNYNFNGGASEVGRRLTEVEYLGKGSGTCFAIDHPSGLHLAGEGLIVTHNTDLIAGLATSQLSPHKRSIVYRTSYPEHKAFIGRVEQILEGTKGRFNHKYNTFLDIPGGKTLELGSVANFKEAQKYQGRPHDLKMFDELANIDELVYTFLIGWTRALKDEGIKTRVVAASNPPLDDSGRWIIKRWRPWLDPDHPNPANPGELRWFAFLDGEDTEITPDISVDGNKGKPFVYKHRFGEEETIFPRSRTFIPATLEDNKYYGTEYKAVLQNMPEPYRSVLLYGDFSLIMRPNPSQVIPAEWIRLARERWKELKESGELYKNRYINPAFGIDVASEGTDFTCFVKLTGYIVQWIDYLQEPNTMKQVNEFIRKSKGSKRAPIGVDAIGDGAGVADRLEQLNYSVYRIKVSRSTKRWDKKRVFRFHDLRSELWWRMREALDPKQEHPLAIPYDDTRLAEELAAPHYELRRGDIVKIQEKDEIRKSLHRSPDAAEALMFALYVSSHFRKPIRMV